MTESKSSFITGKDVVSTLACAPWYAWTPVSILGVLTGHVWKPSKISSTSIDKTSLLLPFDADILEIAKRYKRLHLVICNPKCDLDAIVASIIVSAALTVYQGMPVIPKAKSTAYLAYLPTTRSHLQLHGEVCHAFQQADLSIQDCALCEDDPIDWKTIQAQHKTTTTSLISHQTNKLATCSSFSVLAIFDALGGYSEHKSGGKGMQHPVPPVYLVEPKCMATTSIAILFVSRTLNQPLFWSQQPQLVTLALAALGFQTKNYSVVSPEDTAAFRLLLPCAPLSIVSDLAGLHSSMHRVRHDKIQHMSSEELVRFHSFVIDGIHVALVPLGWPEWTSRDDLCDVVLRKDLGKCRVRLVITDASAERERRTKSTDEKSVKEMERERHSTMALRWKMQQKQLGHAIPQRGGSAGRSKGAQSSVVYRHYIIYAPVLIRTANVLKDILGDSVQVVETQIGWTVLAQKNVARPHVHEDTRAIENLVQMLSQRLQQQVSCELSETSSLTSDKTLPSFSSALSLTSTPSSVVGSSNSLF